MDVKHMKLNIEEKKILYAFGCMNHENTVCRLKWITALTVDAKVKRKMLCLARKLDKESVGEWYPCFYRRLRMENDGYFEVKKHIRMGEKSTDWEEVYGKAV